MAEVMEREVSNIRSYPQPVPRLTKGKVTKLRDVILEKSVSLEGWREIFYKRSTSDKQDTRRKNFERTRTYLVKDGFLEVKDDLYILRFHDAGQTGHDPDN